MAPSHGSARCRIPSRDRPAGRAASGHAPPAAWETCPQRRSGIGRSRRHPCLALPRSGRSFARFVRRFRQADSHSQFAAVKPAAGRRRSVKTAPPPGRFVDRDAAVVGLGDAGHDRQAQAAAVGLRAIAPPEAAEDRFALGLGHARPVVERRARRRRPTPRPRSSRRLGVWRMAFSIRLRTARNSASAWPCTQTGPLDAGQRDGLGRVDGKRRHEAHGLGADRVRDRPAHRSRR